VCFGVETTSPTPKRIPMRTKKMRTVQSETRKSQTLIHGAISAWYLRVEWIKVETDPLSARTTFRRRCMPQHAEHGFFYLQMAHYISLILSQSIHSQPYHSLIHTRWRSPTHTQCPRHQPISQNLELPC